MNKTGAPSFREEPVFVTRDGVVEPYVPVPITSSRTAYAASLHMLFKHVADIHMVLLEVISEKYNIPVTEMVEAIQGDVRYTEMQVNPVIHTMGYVAPSTEQPPEQEQKPQKKKILRIKRT